MSIPKTVWIFWDNGFQNAPELVQACAESCIRHNPGWQIQMLDDGSVFNYVDRPLPASVWNNLSPQMRADFIRLALLELHGGVWVDASLFHMRGLSDWLGHRLPTGLFMFSRPAPDRLVSNWFIGAYPGNGLIKDVSQRLKAYFSRRGYGRPWRGKGQGSLMQRASRRAITFVLSRSPEASRHWFNPIIADGLRIYPYFSCHYMINASILASRESRQIFDGMPKVSSDGPHRVLHQGLGTPLADVPEDLLSDISSRRTPCYKLDWRARGTALQAGTLLTHLLSK